MSTNAIDLLKSGTVPLYLAPQAGVSESPFRRLCRAYGADVVVSEFVSAEGIRRHDRRTHSYLRFHDDERPIGIQIFGAEPDAMAEAARAGGGGLRAGLPGHQLRLPGQEGRQPQWRHPAACATWTSWRRSSGP